MFNETPKIKRYIARSISVLVMTVLLLSSFTWMPLCMNVSAATTPTVYNQYLDKTAFNYPGGSGSTYSSSGCGVYSIVNAIKYMTGVKIDPHVLGQFAIDCGARINGGITTALAKKAAASADFGGKYGFKYTGNYTFGSSSRKMTCGIGSKMTNSGYPSVSEWNTLYSKLIEHLSKGEVAIVLVMGHYMCLVDYDSSTDSFLMLDSAPYTAKRLPKNSGLWQWVTADQLNYNKAPAANSSYNNQGPYVHLRTEVMFLARTDGGSSSGSVTNTKSTAAVIGLINGGATSCQAVAGTPISMNLPVAMSSSTFTAAGWCVAEGGYNGGIYYSLDNGSTWKKPTSEAYEQNPADGNQIVLHANVVCGVTDASATNASFNIGIDLSAYAGQTLTLTLGINTSSTSTQVSKFATFTNVVVPGSGGSGTVTPTGGYQNISVIDTINNVQADLVCLAGAPSSSAMLGSLSSDNKLSVNGWSIVDGGVNGGIYYSVDGGSTWNATSGTYATADSGIISTVAQLAPTFTTSATNGRFYRQIDLSAYGGQTVNVMLANKATDGSMSHFATITGVTVSNTHTCNYDTYTSNGNGTHTAKCSSCGNTGNTTTCTANGTYTSAGNDKHTSTCTVCGGATVATSCTPGSAWSTDGSYHWKTCTACNAKVNSTQALHTGSATCESAATCTTCGKTYGSAGSHNYVTVSGKAATCTQAGLTEGQKCSKCGDVKVAQTTIPAKGHTEVTIAAVQATCTQPGLSEGKKCSICQTVTVAQTTIPAKGHTEVTIAAVQATCTQSGLSEGKKCSTCQTVTVAQTTIPAKGHSFGDWYEIQGSSCTVSATLERKCSVCNYKETNASGASGHTPAPAVKENQINATCTSTGSYDSVIYCSKCSAEISREKKTIAKLGHNYGSEWIIDATPTCATPGSKSHHCVDCGAKTDITEIKSGDHAFGEWYAVGSASCTTGGTFERECSTCHTKQTTTVGANGHTPDSPVAQNKIDATCTTGGSYESVTYCSVCSVELSRETKITGKLGHSYNTEWTIDIEPTCTTVGSKSHHCTRCGDKTDVTKVKVTDHTYGEWYVSQEASCTAPGINERACSACGYKQTEMSSVKGHTFGEWYKTGESGTTATYERKCSACGLKETKTTNATHTHTPAAAVRENEIAATCTANGRYDSVVYCSACREELSRETRTTEKLGHSFGEWYKTGENGTTVTYERKCSVCSFKETKSADTSHTHSPTAAVIENESYATCTTNGRYDSVVYCFTCGAEISRTTITTDALGHNYQPEWTVDIKPTCETAGSKSHHCLNCNDKTGVTEIKATGHSFGEWYKTGESGTAATYERKCSVCSFKETKTTDSTHTHSPAAAVRENEIAATCTADGSYDRVIYCSICADEISRETRTTGKLAHNYSDEWILDVKPTCTTAGSKSHHCVDCGDKTDFTEVKASEHTFGDWYKIDESITLITYERKCSVCGYKETKVIDTDHTHTPAQAVKENVVSATCTTNGGYDSVTYCSECSAEIKRESKTTSKLGHSYGGWTTDKEPACETAGSKSRHCSRCDEETDVTVIPATGHTFGNWYEIQAASCTAEEIYERSCSVCNRKETNVFAPTGHSNSRAVIENKINATCMTNGSYDSVIYCAVCSAEVSRETKTIDALGHNYSTEWTVDTAPTCMTVGSKSHHCMNCDEIADVTEIAQADHSFTNYTSNNDATYTEDGTKTAKCDVCDQTNTTVDEGSALGLVQKFKDDLAAMTKADTQTTYAELYALLETYAALSDEEKATVEAEFEAVQQMIAAYNENAKTANTELADATEIAFAPIVTTGFTFLAALWFLLRKKFLI